MDRDRAASSSGTFRWEDPRAEPRSVNASFPRGSGWFNPGTPRLVGAHGFKPPLPSPSFPFPFFAWEHSLGFALFDAQPELESNADDESVNSDLSDESWTGRTAAYTKYLVLCSIFI